MKSPSRIIASFLCSWGLHRGPVIGEGRIIPTSKKNHVEVIIEGTWRVRRCARLNCVELYAGPADRVKP